MKRRNFIMASVALATIAFGLVVPTFLRPNYWFTPDQSADRLFRDGRFDDAAKTYQDPYRRGVAVYRTGNFKDAAAAFATVATAESEYDCGNCLVMLGKYADAVKCYDRALALKPGWQDAVENRGIAVIRRNRLTLTGGDETGGEVQADKVVFEKGKNPNAGEKTEVAGGPPLTDEQLRGLWLRRVQTNPADFLRAKFAFQTQEGKSP